MCYFCKPSSPFPPWRLAGKWIKVFKGQTNRQTDKDKTTQQNLQGGKLDKELPDGRFVACCVCGGAACEREKTPRRHPLHEDKSQWDRKWVRALFIHGQPSIKELFPEKHADAETHTDGDKNKKEKEKNAKKGDRHAPRADEEADTCAPRCSTTLHSYSNSATSADSVCKSRLFPPFICCNQKIYLRRRLVEELHLNEI